jgi:hypothetical protein
MPAMDYDRVARLYDSYVQTDVDVPFFLREARKAAGAVLELTAGTGRVSIPLLEAGIDLTCADSSSAMLDVFREKLRAKTLTAELVRADMCELSLDRRFALIFVPFHSFAEVTDPARQRQALSRIHVHLHAAQSAGAIEVSDRSETQAGRFSTSGRHHTHFVVCGELRSRLRICERQPVLRRPTLGWISPCQHGGGSPLSPALAPPVPIAGRSGGLRRGASVWGLLLQSIRAADESVHDLGA